MILSHQEAVQGPLIGVAFEGALSAPIILNPRYEAVFSRLAPAVTAEGGLACNLFSRDGA